MRHQHLKFQIIQAGEQKAEAMQVSRRLKELLPKRLDGLTQEYRARCSAGKAKRLALQDQRYLACLEEIIEIDRMSQEYRVMGETRQMLLWAWQSVEAFHR